MPPGRNLLVFDFLARDRLSQTFDQVQKKVKEFGPALAAGGAVAGGALAAGIAQGIEFEAANAKLQASLGGTTELSRAAGEAAGNLYADAYGGSMEETSAAVGAVVTSIEGMRDANAGAIQDMTAKAMTVASVFGVDVARAAQVAGQMITTGLAEDGTQAMDLLTASMQAVPAAVRDDVMDAVDEYGPFMQQIGVTGERAMNLLVASAEDGAFGLDKTGDALKEFTIRATDMSTTTGQAYATLGMDMETMTNQLLTGGETGAAAFQQIVEGLLAIEDPAAQSQAAIQLFGAPIEDLNVGEIPDFLANLSDTTDMLGEVEGATDKAGAVMADTAQTKITEFTRGIEMALAELVTAPGIVGDAATVFGGLGAAVMPLGADLGGLALALGGVAKAAPGVRDGVAKIVTNMGQIPATAKGAATGVANSFRAMSTAGKTATLGLGGIGIALAAAAAAAELFGQESAEAAGFVDELAATLDPATAAITAETEALIANELATTGALEAGKQLGISAETVAGAALGVEEDVKALNDALAEHEGVQQKAAYRALGTTGALSDEEEAALLLKEQIPELSGRLDEATEKQKQVAEGTEAAAAATEEHATAAEKAAEATQLQVASLKELADTVRAQVDPVFAVTKANLDLGQARQDVTAALEEHGAKSTEYAEALDAEALAVVDVLDAVGALEEGFTGKLDPAMVHMLEQAGISEEALANMQGRFFDVAAQVGNMNEKLDETPAAVNTQFGSNLDEAVVPLDDYLEKLEKTDDPRLAALSNSAEEAGMPLDIYLGKLDGATVPRATPLSNNAAEAGIPVDILEAKYQGATVPRFTPLSNNAAAAGIPVDILEGKYEGATVPRNTNLSNNAATAQGPVDNYRGSLGGIPRNITTVVTTFFRRVGQAITGRAEGGPVSLGEVALVGEEGPELVRFGSAGHVIPARETAELLRGGLADGTGGVTVAGGMALSPARISVGFDFPASTGSRLMDALVADMRRYIRVNGGNVQAVLGQGG